MWSTAGAAANTAATSAASRSTDDVIADLTQELANCQADSVSNESLNTQSLLAQLERDIDNMEWIQIHKSLTKKFIRNFIL